MDPMYPEKHPYLGALIFLGMGLSVWLIMTMLIIWQIQFQRHAFRAEGSIISYREAQVRGDDGRYRDEYCPLIEFTTDIGQRIIFDSGGCNDSRPTLGRSVKVLYPPEDPSKARLDSWSTWFFLILGYVLSAPFVIFGAYLVNNTRHELKHRLRSRPRKGKAKMEV